MLVGTIMTREELWAKQREERGFDDGELWNLDYTIAEFVLPRLKEFKRINPCCPYGLKEREWNSILHKMIWSFQQKYDDIEFAPKELTEAQKKLWYKRYSEGFKLFGKYFGQLWF